MWDVETIINLTMVPVILISAIGLLTLTFQNRYSRVKDSVYVFQKQKIVYLQNGEKNKAQQADIMLSWYQKEAKMIKNAMFAAFISILFIVVTSLSIMVMELTSWLYFDIVVMVSFTLAILSLVVSIALIIASLVRSVKTLNYEVEKDDDGVRFGL